MILIRLHEKLVTICDCCKTKHEIYGQDIDTGNRYCITCFKILEEEEQNIEDADIL